MIKKEALIKEDLVGNFYCLEGNYQRPAIVVISGSDGGIPGQNAIPEAFIEHLTANGFHVLALAYFGVFPLKENLENISLEYFVKAVAFLKAIPQVDPNKIGIFGQSRGAELALILGAYFPDLFQAIIASSPSNSIIGGFPFPNREAWEFQGRPLLPKLTAVSGLEEDLDEAKDLKLAIENKKIPYHANTEDDPCNIADLFSLRLQQKEAFKAQIPIEKIRCPLLLLAGDQDAIWPSKEFIKRMMHRLEQKGKSLQVQAIVYNEAGHGIISSYDGAIYHPKGHFWCRLGGTHEGNTKACLQSWNDILKFLKELGWGF